VTRALASQFVDGLPRALASPSVDRLSGLLFRQREQLRYRSQLCFPASFYVVRRAPRHAARWSGSPSKPIAPIGDEANENVGALAPLRKGKLLRQSWPLELVVNHGSRATGRLDVTIRRGVVPAQRLVGMPPTLVTRQPRARVPPAGVWRASSIAVTRGDPILVSAAGTVTTTFASRAVRRPHCANERARP
jgi:hypothetical protein